jgi:hypothetical protein
MKTIELTREQVALVDDEDWPELSKHKWYANWIPHRRVFVAVRDVNGTHVQMHRAIMAAQDHEQVDHRDNNTLNNQRYNLRTCTNSQNCCNKPQRAGTSSQYKGVHWHKQTGKWQASITINGARQYLGLFTDETDAARAYDVISPVAFGAFAHLNFPVEATHGPTE